MEIRVDENGVRSTGALLYYASVNASNGKIYTTRSRAIAIVGIGDTIYDAEVVAEKGLAHIGGDVYVRHDIGKREVIERKVQRMMEIRKKGKR